MLDTSVARSGTAADANDVMCAPQAAEDYDPGPGPEKIQAPLLAVHSADDLINPPELGIPEREIRGLRKGRAVVVPLSEETRGHAEDRARIPLDRVDLATQPSFFGGRGGGNTWPECEKAPRSTNPRLK